MNLKDTVQAWLDERVAKIIANYDRDNMRASGSFAKSLRTEVNDSTTNLKATIFGSHHSLFVDQGRNSGKRPPASVILKWIEDKKIQPNDISKNSLAFLIARKIGDQGWKPKNSYPTGVISSAINQIEINKLLVSLSKVAVTNIRTEVWQKLA